MQHNLPIDHLPRFKSMSIEGLSAGNLYIPAQGRFPVQFDELALVYQLLRERQTHRRRHGFSEVRIRNTVIAGTTYEYSNAVSFRRQFSLFRLLVRRRAMEWY